MIRIVKFTLVALFALMIFCPMGFAVNSQNNSSSILLQDKGIMPTKQFIMDSGLADLLWNYEHKNIQRSPEIEKVFSQAEKVGGLRITIKVNHELSEDELSYLEREFAARFTTDQYGKVVHIGEFYHPIVPFDKIRAMAVLPYIIGMSTGAWPPLVPCLDTSNPEARADLAWLLRDINTRNLTGKGIRIAVYDTGIDIFHPDFWAPDPDRQLYNWLDWNNNGVFDSGIDFVDYNNSGTAELEESLRFWNAEGVPGNNHEPFEANIDWLFMDANLDGNRDFGPDDGFREQAPCYGEPLFIVKDTSGNNQLNVNEQLIMLSKCKIMMVYQVPEGGGEPVTRRRGIDLIQTRRDMYGHGTTTAGVIAAGSTEYRRYTGIAPDPISYLQQQEDGGLMICDWNGIIVEEFMDWALLNGADIMLYEFGAWVHLPLDGSHDVELQIDRFASDHSIVQIVPAGNLADGQKHFHTTVNQAQHSDIHFRVPAQPDPEHIYNTIWQSAIWMDNNKLLSFYLMEPNGNWLNLGTGEVPPGEWLQDNLAGHEIQWARRISAANHPRLDLKIYRNQGITPGDWILRIENAHAAEAVDGYLMDNLTAWSGGVTFLDNVSVERTVTHPATATQAITVAAYNDSTGQIESYSGRGPRVDGVQIVEISAPGADITTTESGNKLGGHYGGYETVSGTSPAAPHVTGAVALLLQKEPGLTPAQIKQRIQDSARTDSSTGAVPNNTWGYGKLDCYETLNGAPNGPYIAQTSVNQELQNPAVRGSAVLAPVSIDGVKDGQGNPVQVMIGGYYARKTYPNPSISVLDVLSSNLFKSPYVNIDNSGQTTWSHDIIYSGGAEPPWPKQLNKLVLRLNGSAKIPVQLIVHLERSDTEKNSIIDNTAATAGLNIVQENGPIAKTYLRGDAKEEENSVVNATDALYISQYLASLIPLSDLNAVNAATPHHNNPWDKITITDALYIQQYLAKLRDEYYQLIQGMGAVHGLPGNANVGISSLQISPNTTIKIPIYINKVTAPSGLGAYDIKVTFNPAMLKVLAVEPGDGTFTPPVAIKIDNKEGIVLMNSFQPNIPGPTKDFVIAYLNITPLGKSGQSTKLNISVTTLADSLGNDIIATSVDGLVIIQ